MQWTIAKNAEITVEEKRSKFLAFTFYVSGEDGAMKILQTLRKKYADAKHICYAYTIGTTEIYSRSSDDGEPAGSAGMPMQSIIQKAKLTNVLCVVVRYFGGVLLGKSLLTRTYARAAKEALDNSGKVVLCEAIYCQEHQSYSDFERLCAELEMSGAWQITKIFDADVVVSYYIKASDKERFYKMANQAGRHIEWLKTELMRMSENEER